MDNQNVKAPEESPAVKLKFTQPTKGTHIFVAEHGEGKYEVSLNKDENSYSVKSPDGTLLTDSAGTRAQGFAVAIANANGSPIVSAMLTGKAKEELLAQEKAAAKLSGGENATKVETLSAQQYAFVSLYKPEGSDTLDTTITLSPDEIAARLSIEIPRAYQLFGDLYKKGVIAVTASGASLLEKGVELYAAKAANPGRTPKVDKDGKVRTPRVAGPGKIRPEWAGEMPTELEYAESQLRNRIASLEHSKLVHRMHVDSEGAADKVAVAQKMVDFLEQKVAYIKEGKDWKEIPSPVAPRTKKAAISEESAEKTDSVEAEAEKSE